MSDDDERKPWISRAALESAGVAVVLALGSGVVAMFHVYETQKSIIADQAEIRREQEYRRGLFERIASDIRALEDDLYNTKLDLYRDIYARGERPGSAAGDGLTGREKRRPHYKPEQ